MGKFLFELFNTWRGRFALILLGSFAAYLFLGERARLWLGLSTGFAVALATVVAAIVRRRSGASTQTNSTDRSDAWAFSLGAIGFGGYFVWGHHLPDALRGSATPYLILSVALLVLIFISGRRESDHNSDE